MFHRGPGLNLTSGQYTAPIAGYYAFSSTLHIGEPSDSPRALPGRSGQALREPLLCPSAQETAEEGAGMPREPPAGADLCAGPLPALQVWQGKAWDPGPGRGEESSNLGKEGQAPSTTVLPLLQQSGDRVPAGEQR